MGMDLKPIAPTADAPIELGEVKWGRYNWTGWTTIERLLRSWGVSTHEFASSNDGAVISAETCQRVADAIAAHISEMDERDRAWLEPHITLWRTCGGYEQW